MFLHLVSKNMISTALHLSDTNQELIKTFKVVRHSVGELIVLNHTKENTIKIDLNTTID